MDLKKSVLWWKIDGYICYSGKYAVHNWKEIHWWENIHWQAVKWIFYQIKQEPSRGKNSLSNIGILNLNHISMYQSLPQPPDGVYNSIGLPLFHTKNQVHRTDNSDIIAALIYMYYCIVIKKKFFFIVFFNLISCLWSIAVIWPSIPYF